MVVLVQGSALANAISRASQALTTVFCGIGPNLTPDQRNTSTFQKVFPDTPHLGGVPLKPTGKGPAPFGPGPSSGSLAP
eukprot:1165033-Prorocentrum_lima.AAC.1